MSDAVGGESWTVGLERLRPGGRLVTCGSTSGVSAETNLMMLFQRQLRLIGSFGCRMENMVASMDNNECSTIQNENSTSPDIFVYRAPPHDFVWNDESRCCSTSTTMHNVRRHGRMTHIDARA